MRQTIPAITIGMPVYNGDKYISGALDSILAQTFTDFELIISDNASSDETQSICEEYASREPRIRYVRQTENRGALANFQFVLDQARGEFFMWAAADDLWDKNWIGTIYTRIRSEKNIAGFGKLSHIDERGTTFPHPANGVRLQFRGCHLWRKLAFYLAYEGKGKANLFYALYPRAALQGIDLCGYHFDYQILFSLLDRVAFMQVKGAGLYKRIHGECGGGAVDNVWRSPVFLAPARVLQRDFQIATHYLECVRPRLRVVLLLLIPIKLLVALKFHVLRGITHSYKRHALDELG
jgi:glycosyltransferase involved in cell wall biosynthesis